MQSVQTTTLTKCFGENFLIPSYISFVKFSDAFTLKVLQFKFSTKSTFHSIKLKKLHDSFHRKIENSKSNTAINKANERGK